MADSNRGIVATVQDHFNRAATNDVWEEIDALRKRVAELEAENAALIAVLTRAGSSQ